MMRSGQETKPKGLYTGTKVMIITGCVFLLAGVLMIGLVNRQMKHHALTEAEAKARIMLDRNLATHTYFSHHLKPRLFNTLESKGLEPDFDPVWMSSTYAVREMEKINASLSDEPYSYKECAVNARHPLNEADAFEKDFIQDLNRDPKTVTRAAIRVIDGNRFYTVLRRGEVMEEYCLRCHSVPELAPKGLVDLYGPKRSFNRSIGEWITAISIRIPLEIAYVQANQTSLELAGLFIAVMMVVYGIVVFLHSRWVLKPLKDIREKALLISSDPSRLGEVIQPQKGREMSQLAGAFNTLSKRLLEDRDELENKVAERTVALQDANKQLRREINEHGLTIRRLEETLGEIKELRGILPICASCKKIRNDTGYWEQIEEYIGRHSKADFSHSICPECAALYYPDENLYTDS